MSQSAIPVVIKSDQVEFNMDCISTIPAALPSEHVTPDGRPFALQGQYVRLEVLSYHHMHSLFRNLDKFVFDFVPWQAPEDEEKLWSRFESARTQRGFFIYAIKGDPSHVNPLSNRAGFESGRNEVLGTIGYMDIRPEHRSIETGVVLFGPILRRTVAATEAHYLLLRNACEPPGGSPPYRRIAWKCNSLNVASRRAAERMGYTYEGTMRNHMILQDVTRSSDFLSILIEEWPVVKKAAERWMARENFDESGQQRRTLEEIRVECQSEY